MALDIARKAQRALVEHLKTQQLSDLTADHIHEGYGPGPTGFLGFLGAKLPRIGVSCESAEPTEGDSESGVFEATASIEIRSEAHDTSPDKHGSRVKSIEDVIFQDSITYATALSQALDDFTALQVVRGGTAQEVDGDILVTTLTMIITCIGSDLS